MKNSDKIYIAGHRGLVGSAIFRQLKSEGYTNIVFRKHSELDLENQLMVEDFFKRERPEYVFLSAAKVGGIMANSSYPADFIYNNIIIQANVIHASYKYGVKKLLFLGSSCIYPKHASQPLKEESLLTGELEPTNEPYAVAKIAGIKMCQSYNSQYNTNFISVMPTNLFGPNDSFDLENSHVLPALLLKFHRAKVAQERSLQSEVVLWGSGMPKREFLYIDDLADACVFLMKSYDKSEIINVGSGTDITIKELAGIIKEIVGYDGKIVWDKTKPDGTPRKILDSTKIKELGWNPKTHFKKGIELTYEWYLNNIQPDVAVTKH